RSASRPYWSCAAIRTGWRRRRSTSSWTCSKPECCSRSPDPAKNMKITTGDSGGEPSMSVFHETDLRLRPRRRHITAAVALALAPFTADAQLKPPPQKPVALDEVVVTATRVEEGSFDL